MAPECVKVLEPCRELHLDWSRRIVCLVDISTADSHKAQKGSPWDRGTPGIGEYCTELCGTGVVGGSGPTAGSMMRVGVV